MSLSLSGGPPCELYKEAVPIQGTKEDKAELAVLVQGPDNITVTMGTEVSMQCTVRGFPVPMVNWFKDGCLLSSCSATFSLLNNGQLLILRSDTPQDSRETFGFFSPDRLVLKHVSNSRPGGSGPP
uniref:Ig-like domain-containing protein n=1 Tax=Poecilia latipinna TaxID=48699 RepID=A0A3B3U9V6_9TELE